MMTKGSGPTLKVTAVMYSTNRY